MHQPFTLMQYNKLPQKEDCKFIEVDTIYFLQIKGYKVQNENTQFDEHKYLGIEHDM